MGLSGVEIRNLEKKEDTRGWLIEVLKKDDITKEGVGQFYISAANPGQTKANHYHTRKTEWFCVINGNGELLLEDIKTMETQKVPMSIGRPVLVKIPPNIAHAIKNIGKDTLILLSYVNETFNPEDTDTFKREVIR